jgi:hypothetical protein
VLLDAVGFSFGGGHAYYSNAWERLSIGQKKLYNLTVSHTAQGTSSSFLRLLETLSAHIGPIQTLDRIRNPVANLGKLRDEVRPHIGHRSQGSKDEDKDKDDLGKAFALFGYELGNLDCDDRAAEDEGESGEDDDEAHGFYSIAC